jgi:RNA-binding protein
MEFTGKQKAKLKVLANQRNIMFQVGQNGLTDNVINNIFDNLRKYEVGRISVLKTSPMTIDEIISELEELGIYVISKIGRVVLLYRENKNLKDRIRL